LLFWEIFPEKRKVRIAPYLLVIMMVGLGGLEPPTSPLSGLRDWKIMQNRARFGVALLRRFACQGKQGRLA
jgi:hypothetical protein